MKSSSSLSGEWKGRLVDVQGFEGVIVLKFEDSGKESSAVVGYFDATIAATHTSLHQSGIIKGTLKDDNVQLTLEAGKEKPFVIQMEGVVISLKRGGTGLRGSYNVAGRGYSPLQAGVICANKDQPLTALTIGIEQTGQPQEQRMKRSRSPSRKKS